MNSQNPTPQLTPGIQTSEFYVTLFVDLLAVLALFGVHIAVSDALVQAVADIAALLTAGLATHGYVTGRSDVKVALATAQGAVGAAKLASSPVGVIDMTPKADTPKQTPLTTRAATVTVRTDPTMPAQTAVRSTPTPPPAARPVGPVDKADAWATDTAPIPAQQNNPTPALSASGYQSIFPQGVPS